MTSTVLLAMAFAALCSVANAASVIPQKDAIDLLIIGTPDDLKAGGYSDGCADVGALHPCFIPHGKGKPAKCWTQACYDSLS